MHPLYGDHDQIQAYHNGHSNPITSSIAPSYSAVIYALKAGEEAQLGRYVCRTFSFLAVPLPLTCVPLGPCSRSHINRSARVGDLVNGALTSSSPCLSRRKMFAICPFVSLFNVCRPIKDSNGESGQPMGAFSRTSEFDLSIKRSSPFCLSVAFSFLQGAFL